MLQIRSRIEYLIPTDYIVVLDWRFNLTKKSKQIDRLLYDLMRFVDDWEVAFLCYPVKLTCIQNTNSWRTLL